MRARPVRRREDGAGKIPFPCIPGRLGQSVDPGRVRRLNCTRQIDEAVESPLYAVEFHEQPESLVGLVIQLFVSQQIRTNLDKFGIHKGHMLQRYCGEEAAHPVISKAVILPNGKIEKITVIDPGGDAGARPRNGDVLLENLLEQLADGPARVIHHLHRVD